MAMTPDGKANPNGAGKANPMAVGLRRLQAGAGATPAPTPARGLPMRGGHQPELANMPAPAPAPAQLPEHALDMRAVAFKLAAEAGTISASGWSGRLVQSNVELPEDMRTAFKAAARWHGVTMREVMQLAVVAFLQTNPRHDGSSW